MPGARHVVAGASPAVEIEAETQRGGISGFHQPDKIDYHMLNGVPGGGIRNSKHPDED